jgi:hypothetical protein
MNADFLRLAFWLWLAEIGVAGFNFFVLMNRVYQPRVGALRAHQIGMTTRIVSIFVFATLLTALDTAHTTIDLVEAGLSWLILTLVFEWGGSFLMRRPVREILIGWHVNQGYMWPYVLAAYLLSPLVIGSLMQI